MALRIAGILKDSVVNGTGIRDVLFVQGCDHHCKGCHNPQTWDFQGGRLITVDELMYLVSSDNDLTISGGDPIYQIKEIRALLRAIKYLRRLMDLPEKNVWLYTGFKCEDLRFMTADTIAENVDVLVDGEFREDLKDLRLPYRGSSNQRLIDVRKSYDYLRAEFTNVVELSEEDLNEEHS